MPEPELMSVCQRLWQTDDLTPCAKHLYVQLVPYSVLLAISLAIVLYGVLPKLLNRGYWSLKSLNGSSSAESEESTPFLNESTKTVSGDYGSMFMDGDTNDEESVVAKPQTQELGIANDARVLIIHRTTAERVRVAVEALILVAQTALCVVGQRTPAIADEWNNSYPITPLVAIEFWAYLLILCLARLSQTSPSLNLWSHAAVIYFFAFLFSLPQLRSALIHPLNTSSQYYYIASSILTLILFVNIILAHFGDRPARIYQSPGILPSPEPMVSLFQFCTYSWVDKLIWKGYKQALNMADIWDLREDDHAFYQLNEFKDVKPQSSITWRLISYFKRSLLIAFFWAFIYSFINFLPTVFLKKILEYVDDPSDTPRNVAWLYVVGMLVMSVAYNICFAQALYIGRRICVRLRSIIIGEVYAKALKRKISPNSAPSSNDSNDNETENEEGKEENKEGNTQANLGAIINLMAVDAFKVAEVCSYLHYLVDAILTFTLAIVFLYRIMGYSALAGVVLMIILFPINYWLSAKFSKMQIEIMALTDQRIEKTNEILQAIRIIKFFAWEKRFAKVVTDVREKELKVLKERFVVSTLVSSVWFLSPTIITMFSFGIYTMIEKRQLTTSVAFTALSLFNIMRTPMDQISNTITSIVQSKVSLERVQKFIDEENTGKYVQLSNNFRGPNSPIIGFEQASFAWDILSDDSDFRLRDLDIAFQIGKLNVIVGPTGAGKSSLLLALLGEMDLIEGQVFLPAPDASSQLPIDPHTGLTESVAYCSQQAWLLNASVRDNILFASDFDESRYDAVVDACGLKRDLEILENGDSTEVGEKGIVLSGGQKQRISLARALYSRSRHLLLDDCLSAVDSHTALWIYDNSITGPMMKDRTCILVSHNVALTVGMASHIIVMENGRIKVQGPPGELAAAGALGDDELVNASASQSASRVQSVIDLNKSNSLKSNSLEQKAQKLTDKLADINSENDEATIEIDAQRALAGKLIQEENRSTGRFNLSVYTGYAKSMGGHWFWILILTVLVGEQLANIVQSWWIREWTISYNNLPNTNNTFIANTLTGIMKIPGSDNLNVNSIFGISSIFTGMFSDSKADIMVASSTKPVHTTVYYILIYGLLGVLYMLVSTMRDFVVFFGGLNASKNLFNQLLTSVLFAKLRFFDSTPVGRIMNRFSKDIESIDQEISPTALYMVQSLLNAVAVVILISIITPGFLIAGVFIMAIYYFIGSLYLETSRELKRLESITKSPVYQHFGETLVGVPTIRAYGHESRFIRDNLGKIDTNNRPFFYMWVCNRWLSFRVDFAGALVTFFSGAFVLLSIGKIDSGLAGLSLSYAITFNANMLWVIRMYANNEMNMNSVERVQEYLNIEKEAPAIIENSRPPVNWPSRGTIEVEDLSLRYAPDLACVIKNASFSVRPGSKVGIVGRTGAGKSTIITAFFRLIEAETGSIKIDDIDISTIGLRDLRQALAIIPQDPTLFMGTIRSNLDPFDQYSDTQIYEALHRVRLITRIPSSVAHMETEDTASGENENRNQFYNLSSPVSEGGSNLSQGQRQLMCLARSLLKSPKVILLDEATASIDYETDAQIQKTIREEFNQTTILTIAHRLRSIIDYDMILVLDAGRVVEFNNPYILLQNKDGLFRDMCANSGEMAALEQIAEISYKNRNGI
ncbi:hypothetical protein NADFUDRAFT_84114 [Nadsonia fulvescens var. elongata DSM 6958]|uniref:P-loop containing nucleoside triphosphate hydrolase protein n=1 Tax=Nadsonia fulvescens var. elongata DSM 6958 TaxID=857566 RepID=A0A1E3PGX3_9ASCO|nr:hypothetical protein NADFUDRAFT_84114 [Nadsonia fulvescens var. elongata DSM 6958]